MNEARTGDRPDPAEAFHAHLDECARCANEPFNLCAAGHVLLLLTAQKSPNVEPSVYLQLGCLVHNPTCPSERPEGAEVWGSRGNRAGCPVCRHPDRRRTP